MLIGQKVPSGWVSLSFFFVIFVFLSPLTLLPRSHFLLLINGRTLPFTMPCMQMQVY